MKKRLFAILMICILLCSGLSIITSFAIDVNNEDYDPVLKTELSADRTKLTLTPTLPQNDENNDIYSYCGFLLTLKDGCKGTVSNAETEWVENLNVYVPLDSSDSYYMFSDTQNSYSFSSCVCFFWSEYSFEISLTDAPDTGIVAEITPFPLNSTIYYYDGDPSEWSTNPVWAKCEDWADIKSDFYAYCADWSAGEPNIQEWNTMSILGDDSVTISSGDSTVISIPASSITDSTKGAATVTGTVSDGTATLNVVSENDKACVVAYTTDDGTTYTRANAVKADNGYDFVFPNYSESMKFVVGLSGDADGDGSVGTSDYTAIARSLLLPENGRYQALSVVNRVFADADGDGTVGTSDYTAIARSLLLESNARYAAIEWK